MPSICTNLLLLEGTPAEIEAFRQNFVSFDAQDCPRLDFQAIVPMPAGIDVPAPADTPPIQEKSTNDWLKWRTAHWGSKWNGTGGRWSLIGRRVAALSFNTPWGPPDAALHALARDPRRGALTAVFAARTEYGADGAWLGAIQAGRFTSKEVQKDNKNLSDVFDLANPPRVPDHIIHRMDRLCDRLSRPIPRAAAAA